MATLESELSVGLEIPEDQITDETPMDGLDSLGRITVMVYADISLNIILSADDLLRCKTVGDLRSMLKLK